MHTKTKKNLNVSLVAKNNLCCGCGMCKTACPHQAISISFDKNKQYQPCINAACINCGLCLNVCPMAPENLSQRIESAIHKRSDYGFDHTTAIYKGYQTNEDSYIKSASGGMLSALLKYMLDNKIVDAVIHAQPMCAGEDEKYFRASISTSAQEIEDKKGSFYYPIEFSDVLTQIKNNPEIQNVAVAALPCVLSGIKLLKEHDEVFARKIRYSLSVICSHNVTGQFADCIASHFPEQTPEKKINFRDKHDIPTADDFSNSVEFANGNKLSDSRFKTPFTRAWRSYAYALNPCLFCPDFIGEDADAAFKDAWGFTNLVKKQGESLVVVKNDDIEKFLREIKQQGLVDFHDVEMQRFKNSQKMTLDYKTGSIDFRARKHRLLRRRLKKIIDLHDGLFIKRLGYGLDFHLKRLNMRVSKSLRRVMGMRNPIRWFKAVALLTRFVNYPLGYAHRVHEYHLRMLPGRKVNILYAGGFGYENLGDEAQLSANISLWQKYLPCSRLTIMSPNPDYTLRAHGPHRVTTAPRVAFWGFGGIEYGGIMRHRVMQMYFIFRYLQLRFNAFFVKHFNFAPLLDTDRAALLGEIKNADILHIGGGGFLTGKTASRLYDNMFLIRLAQYLDTDVILTGHTLGVWQSRFQKILAKWGLKNVRYIGLRDNSASVNDLKEINRYDPDRVYPTFDDALFCGAADKSEIDAYLSANGMDPSRGYIVCNTHYWQVAPSRVNPALLQMAQALDHISRKHGYNIIFMPMHPSDNNALALTKHLMKEPSHIMKHRGNVRLAISAFQNAELCFTMKHHPIVFAMSAGIPTLSVAFEQYYNHKNRGALSLFNQQKFSILVGENDGEMIEMLEHLIDNRAEVSREIMGHMDKYREQEGEVMHRYLHDHKQV